MRDRVLLPVQTRADKKTAEERNITHLVAQNTALKQQIALLRHELMSARNDLAKCRSMTRASHIPVPLV